MRKIKVKTMTLDLVNDTLSMYHNQRMGIFSQKKARSFQYDTS